VQKIREVFQFHGRSGCVKALWAFIDGKPGFRKGQKKPANTQF
jgi:hypothetical protein